MRTATQAQLGVLADPNRRTRHRVLIEDADGAMRDWSDQGGIDWQEAVEVHEDVDGMVAGATLTLARDADGQSISPLREDSPHNRDAGNEYAPAIEPGRAVEIQIETVHRGDAFTGDWVVLFRGHVDDVGFGERAGKLVCPCRNRAGELHNRWIEEVREYGDDDNPVPLQDVMQAIADDELGPGEEPLVTVGDPDFGIVRYEQQREGILTAWEELSGLIGWDLRARWNDAAEDFRMTLSEPDRDIEEPHHTFGPDDYVALTELTLSRVGVRNVVEGEYTDANGDRQSVKVEDQPSIQRFGRRYMLIEIRNPQINTAAKATALITAVLQDVRDPKVSHAVSGSFFWPIEIGDFYRWLPNGIYDSAQELAAVGYRHILERDRRRTEIFCRGNPSGGYKRWLRRERPALPDIDVDIPDFGFPRSWSRTYTVSASQTQALRESDGALLRAGGLSVDALNLDTGERSIASFAYRIQDGAWTLRSNIGPTTPTAPRFAVVDGRPHVRLLSSETLAEVRVRHDRTRTAQLTDTTNLAITKFVERAETADTLTLEALATASTEDVWIWVREQSAGAGEPDWKSIIGSQPLPDRAVGTRPFVFGAPIPQGGTDARGNVTWVYARPVAWLGGDAVFGLGLGYKIAARPHIPVIDDGTGELTDGSIRAASQFAQGLDPVGVGDELPPNGDEFRVWLLTSDDPPRLYRWDEDAQEWTKAVPTVDVVGEFDTSHIADDAITTAKIVDAAVAEAKLAAQAVSAEKIVDDAVLREKIAAAAIDAPRLASEAVTEDAIAAGSIVARHMIVGSFDNLVQNPSFETGALGPHQTNSGGGVWSVTSSTPISGNFSARWANPNQNTGEAQMRAGGLPTVTTAGHPRARAGDQFHFRFFARRRGAGPTWNNVRAAIRFHDANGALVGQTSGPNVQPTDALGGTQVSVSATAPANTSYAVFNIRIPNEGHPGVLDFDDLYARRMVEGSIVVDGTITTNHLEALSITTELIASNAVVATKIAANAVEAAKIAAGAVVAEKIAAGAVITGKLAALAVTTEKIDALAVTAEKVAANAIVAAKIAAGAVEADKIAVNAITADHLAANSVTAGAIAAGAVQAQAIAAGAVIAEKIAAGAVTADKIQAGAVTADKIEVSELSEIAENVGIIVSGVLTNAAGTRFLDLDASGSEPFLKHDNMELLADGTATFAGELTAANTIAHGNVSIRTGTGSNRVIIDSADGIRALNQNGVNRVTVNVGTTSTTGIINAPNGALTLQAWDGDLNLLPLASGTRVNIGYGAQATQPDQEANEWLEIKVNGAQRFVRLWRNL